jgi:hypothetical protein
MLFSAWSYFLNCLVQRKMTLLLNPFSNLNLINTIRKKHGAPFKFNNSVITKEKRSSLKDFLCLYTSLRQKVPKELFVALALTVMGHNNAIMGKILLFCPLLPSVHAVTHLRSRFVRACMLHACLVLSPTRSAKHLNRTFT